MGVLSSKHPNSSEETDISAELLNLDNNLARAQEKIDLLRKAAAEINVKHADLKSDHIQEKYKNAAKDLKEIAINIIKDLNSYEKRYCEERQQNVYRTKSSATNQNRKVEIQLYCAQRTDITDQAMKELARKLTNEQFHQGIKLTVQTRPTLSSILTGMPLIVICFNSSRLGTDFSKAVSSVPDGSNTAVLMFHLKKQHALPTQPSNAVLNTDEVKKFGTIIDVAFFEDMGLYDCEMNKSAGKALFRFIEEHLCKGSQGESEIKEQEQLAQRPSPSPKLPPSPALLSRPWRHSHPLNQEQLLILQERVENYSIPLDLKAKQARILLLGPVGAGKCSFVNTISSIFQGQITQNFLDCSDMGSLAMEYQQHEVQSSRTGIRLNFRLCVLCGEENNKGPDLADLIYLVKGNVPVGYKFSSTSISQNMNGFIHKPEPSDKVHCLVFLFDASSVKATDQDTWEKISELQTRTKAMGIPIVILLTKIDTLLEPDDRDLTKVFFSNDVKKAVMYTSEKLRISLGNIMPIKNYKNENDLNEQMSCLALQALNLILGYAEDFLVNQNASEYEY